MYIVLCGAADYYIVKYILLSVSAEPPNQYGFYYPEIGSY